MIPWIDLQSVDLSAVAEARIGQKTVWEKLQALTSGTAETHGQSEAEEDGF